LVNTPLDRDRWACFTSSAVSVRLAREHPSMHRPQMPGRKTSYLPIRQFCVNTIGDTDGFLPVDVASRPNGGDILHSHRFKDIENCDRR
jgi:hypothetical protein